MEFRFSYTVPSRSITLSQRGGGGGGNSITIPAGKLVKQTSQWGCPPPYFGDIMLIKCCVSHEVVDFIIVDDSANAEDSRSIKCLTSFTREEAT